MFAWGNWSCLTYRCSYMFFRSCSYRPAFFTSISSHQQDLLFNGENLLLVKPESSLILFYFLKKEKHSNKKRLHSFWKYISLSEANKVTGTRSARAIVTRDPCKSIRKNYKIKKKNVMVKATIMFVIEVKSIESRMRVISQRLLSSA